MLLKGDFVYRKGPPLVAVAARGATLVDSDGGSWVDMQACSGACILGYTDRHLKRALQQVSTLPAKPQFCESLTRIEVARILSKRMLIETGEHGSVGFDLGGAQAIEQALKVVGSANGKADTILVLDGAYHGRSLAISHLSCSSRYRVGHTQSPFRIVRLPVPALVGARMGWTLAAATEYCIQQVRWMFDDERLGLAGAQLHSVVLESVLNVAGMIPVAVEYLLLIADLVHKAGGKVIIDEVFTGVYRLGGLISTPALGKVADVVVLSKGLTNAMVPLSAIWVNNASGLQLSYLPGTHSSTYINGELALAVALEVLAELDLLSKSDLSRSGERIRDFLATAALDPARAACWSEGNVARIAFSNEEDYQILVQALATPGRAGVLVATTGLAPRTVIIHPSLNITDDELGAAFEALSAGLRNCRA